MPIVLKETKQKKGGRRTLPTYASGYSSAAVIPRRGFSPTACRILEAAESGQGVTLASAWGGTALLHLLRVMVESHPIASYAFNNDMDFTFGPDCRIVAVEQLGQQKDNPEGTAAIEALWAKLPREIGGLTGLLEIGGAQLSLTGMQSLEGIPAGVGAGLLGGVDVEPLSLMAVPGSGTNLGASWRQARRGGVSEDTILDPTTFFVGSWHGSVDNPYGIPRYGAALRELISEFGEQQALSDVMRAVAWPHLVFQFAMKSLIEFATTNKREVLDGQKDEKGKPLTAYGWAKREFNKFNDILPGLMADDSILIPETDSGESPVSVVSAGQGLDGALNATVRRAIRIAQGMGHPPSMVNLSLGGTQAYFEEDFKRHCRKLERLRTAALEGALWLAQLHLRLLGVNLLVEVRKAPIYTEDALKAAQARAAEITNQLEMSYAGVIDPNEASQALTQTPMFDMARWEEGRQRWLRKSSGASTGSATTSDGNSNNAN